MPDGERMRANGGMYGSFESEQGSERVAKFWAGEPQAEALRLIPVVRDDAVGRASARPRISRGASGHGMPTLCKRSPAPFSRNATPASPPTHPRRACGP